MANWQLTLPRVAWSRSEVVMASAKARGSSAHAKAVAEVRTCLIKALEILDQVGAPPEVGAHIDLALRRLEAVLDPSSRD